MLDRAALAEVAAVVFSIARGVVSQPTRWRILNERASTIRQKTFDAFVSVLKADGGPAAKRAIARLYYAALGADGFEISNWYRGWLSARLVHFYTIGAPYLIRRDEGGGLRELRNDEVEDFDLLLGKLPSGPPSALARDFHDIFAEIYDSAAGKLLSEFETWIAARGHGDALDNPYLYDHVYRRILEPLLDAPRSAYVERHWRELSEEELRRFVAAGIAREKIMLNRAPEDRRIQAVLAGELPPTR